MLRGLWAVSASRAWLCRSEFMFLTVLRVAPAGNLGFLRPLKGHVLGWTGETDPGEFDSAYPTRLLGHKEAPGHSLGWESAV